MMHERTRRLIADLQRLASEGLTVSQAAAAVGITYNTAAMYARMRSINFHRPRSADVKTERNAEIARRYLGGEAQADLAREFNVTRERVRQICEKAGCVSERKRHTDFVAVVVGTIIRKNLTLGQACEMFDISRTSAYKYCCDNGVVPSRMSEEEREELSQLAKLVETGSSIRQAVDADHNKAERLRRFLKKSGIDAKGRSRHDDFTQRRDLVERWRSEGHSWARCAELLTKHDGRVIGQGGLFLWARRHMPHLFNSRSEVAA
ncbi:hypothetical protein [Rhizobium sp. Root1220]|uniref:hypothetical protein n=1 Tax=Rhizobium sp. Root1220 TaxID=1736432 RepID=UPI0006F9B9A8|nr:hypothetical protein [Rhizobium sp. Root1220]KQV83270.1 hypothetical protein ASC90_22015 [Rhizobium sp. Root1220]